MVKLRKRDLAPPPEPAATRSDVLRLEAVIAEQPPVDLTPIEAELRKQAGEIAQLRTALAKKEKPIPSYVFDIQKDEDGFITNVTARPDVVKARTLIH